MKRVLFICSQPFFEWRGSPIRVGYDVRALAECGCRVDLLTLPMGRDQDIAGVRIVRAPRIPGIKQVPIGPSLAKCLFDAVLFCMALSMGRRYRYDVVHCVEDTGIIGVILSRLIGARFVFEKHSDPRSYKKGRIRHIVMTLYAGIERFTARRAHAVIATGKGLVRQVRQMGVGCPVHHIFDIPSSSAEATADEIATVRGSICQSHDELLVTFVGSFAVYQGVDLMFDAIPAVAASRPEARFVIIGGTEKEIAARKTRLAEQGVAGRVTFPGKVPPDRLPGFLAASDVLLSPRLVGVNTPLKVLDYFKAGRAIVATDTEANRLILDERTAVLARPRPEDFSRAVCRVLEDRALRETLGREGRRLYENRYNFSEFTNRLRACYEGLAETGGDR